MQDTNRGRSCPSFVVAVLMLALLVAVLSTQNYGLFQRSSIGFQSLIKLNNPQSSVESITPTTTEVPKAQLGRKVSTRIDFSTCPENRVVVAPKLSTQQGIGHRMTEVFFLFHFAVIRGYCFCFPVNKFGSNIEVYHLLLEPILPPCEIAFPNRTLKNGPAYATIEKLPPSNVTVDNNSILHIYPINVWPLESQSERPVDGYGDVLGFFDSFLRDNNLVEEVSIPWYQQHKQFAGTAFRNRGNTNNITSNNVQQNHVDHVDGRNGIGGEPYLNATFHLRVGDYILDASEPYWRNVLTAMTNIVELEFGHGREVHIYWIYFQARHRSKEDADQMKDRINEVMIGEWPSEPGMLPPTHAFLAKLCDEFVSIECFWKLGTNMIESIDLYVDSDLVYVSGSSFSQLLSLFNQGVRMVSLTKEFGMLKTPKSSTKFLQTTTNAFNSLRHYYLDATGKLFDEQFSYLRLYPPNSTAK